MVRFLLLRVGCNWHKIVSTLAQSCPFAVNPYLLYLVQSKLCIAAAPVWSGCFQFQLKVVVSILFQKTRKVLNNERGEANYFSTGYSASISGEMSLMPDDIVPTASGKTMKSGYGVKTEVRATLSTDAPTSHITYPQTAFSVFPEFQYQTYLRLLQRSGGQSAKFIFKPNEFSTYDRTVHFTPLWFPDATDYTIYTQVWDTWTPDGMLSINLNDYVSIQGSLYDDWYTNRE